MTIPFAITTTRGEGYTIVRTADNQVMTTVATYGEASRLLDTYKTDPRTEAEKRYDGERSGAIYLQLDDNGDILSARLGSAEADASLTPVLEAIEHHFEAKRPAAPTIEVTHLYRDPSKGNDLTDQPVGPVAYTDYALGDDDARVLVSFDASGNELHEIIMQGQYVETPIEAHLASMEAAIANMRALLSDPRVQAARAARAEGAEHGFSE
jgi:hypothetical protein